MADEWIELARPYWDTAFLVYLATALQALGFLFRKQIVLRLLVLSGSACYVLFYYVHTAEPLWDAMIGSSLIGAANAIGLILLIYSRVPLGMSAQERRVYVALGKLEPGLFRKLMTVGTLCDSPRAVTLTRQGQRPDQLYYVLDGAPEIEKSGTIFRLGNRVFIGELGYMMDTPASATVKLPEGGIYVAWDRDRLKRLCARSPAVCQALDALISRDMACKVSSSVLHETPETAGDAPAPKAPVRRAPAFADTAPA